LGVPLRAVVELWSIDPLRASLRAGFSYNDPVGKRLPSLSAMIANNGTHFRVLASIA